jgi:hypothetical protein
LLNPYLLFLHPLLSFLHSPVCEQAKQKFDKQKAVKVTRTLQPDLPENSLIRTSKHNNNCRKQNPSQQNSSQQDQKEKKEKPKENEERHHANNAGPSRKRKKDQWESVQLQNAKVILRGIGIGIGDREKEGSLQGVAVMMW